MSALGSLLVGAAGGFGVGLTMGFLIAIFSRDGVWPGVWAGLIMASTGIGAALGLLEWVLS